MFIFKVLQEIDRIKQIRTQEDNVETFYNKIISKAKLLMPLNQVCDFSTFCFVDTVESPNEGHIGTSHFVPCREVVLSLKVKIYWFYKKVNTWDIRTCPL